MVSVMVIDGHHTEAQFFSFPSPSNFNLYFPSLEKVTSIIAT